MILLHQMLEANPEEKYDLIYYINYLILTNYWKLRDDYAFQTVGHDPTQDYLDSKSTDYFLIA